MSVVIPPALSRIVASTRVLIDHFTRELDMPRERAELRAVPLARALELAEDNMVRLRALHIFGGIAPEDARAFLEKCGYAPDLRATSGGIPTSQRSSRVH